VRTARNPVLGGSHPDPSVCRVGEDYYLVCSSFEYFPAVPMFHSRDLVHWRQIGNVLTRPEQLRLAADTPTSRGIQRPTIRYHRGRFWVIATDTSAGGTFVVTADRLAGPWSDPVWIDLPGVVPDLAWDEKGNCWCTTSDGHTARVDPHRGTVLEGPFRTWYGGDVPEVPRLYHVGDWWYLLSTCGDALVVARARTPRGPFEPAPGDLGDTARPIDGLGRADLVTTPNGAWWLVLPGTREHPSGFHVLGQEVFLMPVRWENEWPVVDRVTGTPTPGELHPLPPLPVRDDFDEFVLAPSWISPRGRPDGSWSLTARPGWLTLRATGETLDRPGSTFIGRRLRHLDSRVSVRLDPGPAARAGLSIRRDEAHRYDFEVTAGRVDVVARIGPVRQVVASRTTRPGPITLTVVTRTTDLVPPSFVRPTDEPTGVEPAGPDTIAFHVDDDPGPLAELDGRYLSPEVTSGVAGRVAGMYVTRGVAEFDWFDYRGLG
jgi:xylan 1,4-beta-xylosidase